MKPGWKTTEFWLTCFAYVLSVLTASGVLADGSRGAQILAFLVAALATLGYSISRGMAKLPPSPPPG